MTNANANAATKMTKPGNTALLIGALARNPRITDTRIGKVFEATVAGQEQVVDADGVIHNKPFYQAISVTGKFAEILAQRGLTAGTPVLVEGSLDDNRFTTKAGVPVRNLRIRADRVDVLAEDVDIVTDAKGGKRMNGGANETTLVGNLTDKPVLRYTPQGDAVLNLSVAVNESWTDREGKKQSKVHFVEVTVWRELAEAMQHLEKGQPVMVQGRLTSKNYTDKQGNKRTEGRVEATAVRSLTGRQSLKGSGIPAQNAPAPTEKLEDADASTLIEELFAE